MQESQKIQGGSSNAAYNEVSSSSFPDFRQDKVNVCNKLTLCLDDRILQDPNR